MAEKTFNEQKQAAPKGNEEKQKQGSKEQPPEEQKGGVNNHVTKTMKERAENAKAYIESKYSKLKTDEQERKEAWDMLESKMMHLNLSEQEKELIKQDIMHKEAELNRKM